MNSDELRTLLLSGDLAPPFTVHTTGGRSYPVEDAASIWSPPGFPGTVVFAIPRRSIAVVRLDTIDSITCEEHDAVKAHE
jgi:hypothetical protein